MNSLSTCLWFLFTSLLLVGCVSPPTASEAARLTAYMTRWDDVRERKPVQRMAFARGDMPTAIVQNLGWKDQQVSVEFVRQDTGKIVFETAFPLGRNEMKYSAPREPLPAGTYNLKVTPQNSAPIVQNFSVYGY